MYRYIIIYKFGMVFVFGIIELFALLTCCKMGVVSGFIYYTITTVA